MKNSNRLTSFNHFPGPILVVILYFLLFIKHEINEFFFACTISSRDSDYKGFELSNETSLGSLKIFEIDFAGIVRRLRGFALEFSDTLIDTFLFEK